MPDPSALAAQDQAVRNRPGNGGSGQSEQVQRPDITAEPQDVQGLQHLRQTSIDNLFGKIYKNPELAYERNLALNEEESVSLPENPSKLGELKDGAKPSERDMKAIGEVRYNYETSPQVAKDGEQNFIDRENKFKSQQLDTGAIQLSPSESMNQELTRASTSIYQIGSI